MTRKTIPSNDIHHLKKDINKLKDHAAEAAHGHSEELIQTLHELAHQAGYELHKYADVASDQVFKAAKRVETGIRNKPLETAAIVLGLGFLFGFLTRK